MRPSKPAQGKGPASEEPKKKSILNVAEAAELLALPPQEVLQLAQRGILPGTRQTGEWVFPRALLESWQQLQARKTQQNAAQRSITQKLGGLGSVQPLVSSTESYDLSIIDELDLPNL